MSQITLTLPETLQRSLETQAQLEGVALDQYILFRLAQSFYWVKAHPESEVAAQQDRHAQLLQSLGHATHTQIREVLALREPSERYEPQLDSDAVKRLRARLS